MYAPPASGREWVNWNAARNARCPRVYLDEAACVNAESAHRLDEYLLAAVQARIEARLHTTLPPARRPQRLAHGPHGTGPDALPRAHHR